MKLKFYLLTALGLIFINSFGQETEIRDIRGFKGIHVIGNIRCELYPSENDSIEVIARGSDFSNIITEINDEILSLRLKTNTPGDAIVKIKVYYTELNSLFSQAQALIINKDSLEAKHIDFDVRGGGKMELILKLESLSADVKQGGILVLSGTVGKQEITATTGGTYSGYQLEAEDTYVKAVSGGKAKVRASRIIDATATAKAFVGYIGDPVSTFIKTNLGGEIQHTREED